MYLQYEVKEEFVHSIIVFNTENNEQFVLRKIDEKNMFFFFTKLFTKWYFKAFS